MNPIILPPVGQTRFFSLDEATSLRKGKTLISNLRLKIDLVSYPAQAEGLVNIYSYGDSHLSHGYLLESESNSLTGVQTRLLFSNLAL